MNIIVFPPGQPFTVQKTVRCHSPAYLSLFYSPQNEMALSMVHSTRNKINAMDSNAGMQQKTLPLYGSLTILSSRRTKKLEASRGKVNG